VQEVGRGEAIRDDVAGLHELDGQLEGVGVGQATADDDAAVHEAVSARPGAAPSCRVPVRPGEVGDALDGAPVSSACQGGGQQMQQQELSRVGLGGGDGALLARMHQQHLVRDAGQLRARSVRDPERQRAALARLRHHQVDVRRLAGLRDADHQRLAQPQRRR